MTQSWAGLDLPTPSGTVHSSGSWGSWSEAGRLPRLWRDAQSRRGELRVMVATVGADDSPEGRE